ncbi:MAG TPA: hypothetical protein VK477_13375 [Acidobacteriota bacterium]|nr:hypothetical protein [Acidobacteriota bacterium]
MSEAQTPEATPSIFPLVVGALTLTAYDGHSYVKANGETIWSGAAEPSEADATDAVTTPRTRPAPVPSDAQIYAEQLALGFTDPVTGLKLKTTEYAIGKFTSAAQLVQLALSLGAIDAAAPQTFWDFTDVERTLPTSDFLALMLRYGVAVKQTFDTYAP